MDFAQLSAPFAPNAIHWRAQTVTKNGDKALALAYLDARDVMDRLDEAVGPANWRDSYVETPKGRTLCTLEIRVDGEWIAKSDGAGDTDVEGEKGSISDALKRAAVKWGIGRYLYDLGNVWAPCESYEANGKKKWQKWALGADRAFADALQRLSPGSPRQGAEPVTSPPTVAAERPTGPITDKSRDWLQEQIEKHGLATGDVCQGFKIDSLKAITYAGLDEVVAWIKTNRKAA
jgi:hypothetical protein